jgi:hypothetical protein
MLDVTINIEGKTLHDIELAIDEAKRQISAGYYSGMNGNEDGEYSFTVSGEEEIDEEE